MTQSQTNSPDNLSANSQVREPNSFGRRKEPHSIVITRNGQSRQYFVNPIYFSVVFGLMAMFSVGYFAATTYLVLRDDLISARGARDARMQHEYEDRIATLRTNLDRITSRQLLDQQAIETKVSELIARQKQLDGRGSTMEAMVEKAREFGLEEPDKELDQTITGSINPDKQASLLSSFGGAFALRGVGEEQNIALEMNTVRVANLLPDDFTYQANSSLFADVSRSIEGIDAGQKQVISSLRKSAGKKLEQIAKLMGQVGAKLPAKVMNKAQIGGPFEPLGDKVDFSSHLEALDHSLEALKIARVKATGVPVGNPVPGKKLSSRFGSRIDPFKGTYAMHSGLDFKVARGVPILAAGAGKVVFAGRKGGYGKMVEIRHANGLTTRYAHMSRVLVKQGATVKRGITIGKVGSTGRSTGPHLHYELRKHGVAVNPQKYMNVGRKLAKLL